MRISDNEPSSVILSQTVKFKKLKNDDQKLSKQAEAKRDSVLAPLPVSQFKIVTRAKSRTDINSQWNFCSPSSDIKLNWI